MLSVDEAAARLGCAPMDLWRLIHAGDCPGLIHMGRHYIEAGRLDDVLDVLTRPDGCPLSQWTFLQMPGREIKRT